MPTVHWTTGLVAMCSDACWSRDPYGVDALMSWLASVPPRLTLWSPAPSPSPPFPPDTQGYSPSGVKPPQGLSRPGPATPLLRLQNDLVDVPRIFLAQ